MGTRGTFGVRIDGEDKLAYNHFDSYPEELGFNVLQDVAGMLGDWGLEKIKERARALTLVDEDVSPTPDQIADFKDFTNLQVGRQSDDDWYCLLRDLQGQLCDTLTVGYMVENNKFIHDSLFCEWGYILNLDDGVLEVYKGFQKEPHTKGRYGAGLAPVEMDYYPSALIVSFPLDDLPDIEAFHIAINRSGFDTEEEMVLARVNDYDEITRDEATEIYGIKDFDMVMENLHNAGSTLVAEDPELPNLFTLAD